MGADLRQDPRPSGGEAAAHAGGSRPMARSDIPAVAKLFARSFRGDKGTATPELEAYLETVFFGSPHYRPENGSIVHDNAAGGLTSAILALPMEFTVNGRSVIAKLLCAFMADGKEGAAGAARLARQMRAARQDMCFSDNSSPVSADHWVAGGGVVLPVQSLEWQRSFRPLSAGALHCSRHVPALRSRPVLYLLGKLDDALRRRKPSLVPPVPPGCRTVESSPDAFLASAGPMTERFTVRPAWSKPEFDWLHGIAMLNRSLGTLQVRSVVDEGGRTIGAFLFFGKARREATVLNVLCEAGREFAVVGQMFAHLDAEGYARARGMAQPFLMNAISRQRRLSFKHSGYFCMVTRHDEIRDAALRNEIYIGGLASESWSRLLTDF